MTDAIFSWTCRLAHGEISLWVSLALLSMCNDAPLLYLFSLFFFFFTLSFVGIANSFRSNERQLVIRCMRLFSDFIRTCLSH
jgi:hypothetical protein